MIGFPESPEQNGVLISVVIKALNEERRIERCIQSVLSAVKGLNAEIILADSCSTDQTIALAKRYPITIVQLANPEEKCCGIGPQLGYQHSSGEFVYILDGDMEMLDGFLSEAVSLMRAQPQIGGVGGQVVEMNTKSLEYQARTERAAHNHMSTGDVDRLDMGGLYRRAAIRDVGYLSDRNLHSYEEFELASRLRAKGWQLWRIKTESVRHFGHDTPPYSLLLRRWASKYIFGLGELLRAAIGSPEFGLAFANLRELRLYIAVILWWMVLLALAFSPFSPSIKASLLAGLALAPFALMAARKKSMEKGVFSVVSWCFNAAGLLVGLLSKRSSAGAPISSVIIQDRTQSNS